MSRLGRYYRNKELTVMHAVYMRDPWSFRILLAFLGSSVAALFTFYEPLKNQFVSETSEVATQLLSEKDLQLQASVFARTVLDATLKDPVIMQGATQW